MPGGGTRTFLDPDHYEASLREAQIEAIIIARGKFRARLTWAELHHLQVLRCEEDLPRVGFVQLAPPLAFVTFPTRSAAAPVWRGAELQGGEIMLHSRGERLHQSTLGPFVWGIIAIDPAQLERYAQSITGRPLTSPPERRILRPSRRDVARLRRLHAQACRLAETKSKILSHSEVARAIEQDLIQALVVCLATAAVRTDGSAALQHVALMIKFEEILANNLSAPPNMSQLCELLGVNDRALRTCCAEFLGMTPTRYLLLRRLRNLRSALRDADPNTANIAELARRFGFADPEHFGSTYQAIFGESPSTTLQRVPLMRFTAS